jgi:predicted aspartyl protease
MNNKSKMDHELRGTGRIAEFLTSIGYVAIPLRQNVAGQLLIDAKINDVDGTYILDTGAGQTVVDAKHADSLRLKLTMMKLH